VIAAPPPPVALSVAPAHVALAAGGRTTVHVRAPGRSGLILSASVAGLALDGRGRPVVVAQRDAGAWLAVRPRTVATGPLGASFVVVARRPAHARPGDHSAIVLLTAFTPGRKGIAVGIRLGVVVTVRVPGRKLRRLAIAAARLRGRLLSVTIANRGDVIESMGGASLRIALLRGGRTIARLRGTRRQLLPHTRAVLSFRLRAAVQGPLVARVTLTQPSGAMSARRFPLRL
jgi:hypothetical protein